MAISTLANTLLVAVLLAAADGAVPVAAAPESGSAASALTLEEAVRAALERRPELQAAHARADARRAAAAAAFGAFVPRLTTRVWGDQARTPIAGPFNSFFQRDDTLSSQRLAVGVGLLSDLPTGTSLELRADSSVGAYTYYAEALNPRYEPALRVKLSQNLWKGLSPAVNLAPIAVAEADLSIEEAALASLEQAVTLEVAEAWLDASRTASLVRLRETSVELAQQFETLTRQMIDGGSASRLDLALAVQTVAQRRAEIAGAMADRDLAAGRLGELLGAPVPTDGALPMAAPLGETQAPLPSLDDVLAAALQASPALRAAHAAAGRERAAAPLIADAWSPTVRLVVDGSVAGLAGTTTCTSGYLADGLTPCHVPEAYRGGMDRALTNMASGQLYSLGVGVEGELPTFWGPAMSAHTAAELGVAAAGREVVAVEQRVAWQARRLVHDVEQRRALVAAATLNLTLATEALAAEETKLRGGRSTGFALLRAQELRVGAEVLQSDATYQLAAATARLLALMGRFTPQGISTAAPAPSAGDGKG